MDILSVGVDIHRTLTLDSPSVDNLLEDTTMGVSTDGIIAYGVALGAVDDLSLPWGPGTPFEDIVEWWLEDSGYVPRHRPFTDDGEYAEGWSWGDARLDEYFADRRQRLESHPCPVEAINYCSEGYPTVALVVPSSVIRCRRGYPVILDPTRALVVNHRDRNRLIGVLSSLGIEAETEWLLMSYWG